MREDAKRVRSIEGTVQKFVETSHLIRLSQRILAIQFSCKMALYAGCNTFLVCEWYR